MGAAFRSGDFGASFANRSTPPPGGLTAGNRRNKGPRADLCVTCASSGQSEHLPVELTEGIRDAPGLAAGGALAMKSLEGVPDFDRRVRGPRKGGGRLYERAGCLEEFNALFGGALQGSTSCVVIEGCWGTGKTALIGAACEAARRNGAWTARARGRESERRTRYSVLRDALESVYRPWSATVDLHARPEVAVAWRGLLALLEQAGVTPIEVSHRLVEVLSEVGAPLPVAFAVDDADMADNESMAVLTTAIRRVGPERAWLVASTHHRQPGVALRPVDRLLSEPQTRHLVIGPLQPDTVGDAIQQFSGQLPSRAFRDGCFEVTGGRPLLLFALLGALEQDGFDLTVEGDGVAAIGSVVVPRIAQVVLDRLSAMSIATSDLLGALAVLGDGADLSTARDLARIDGLAAERGADSAVLGELLEPGRPLRFTSPLIRAAIYHDIPPARRARLHADAARVLEGEDGPEEQVLRHLLLTEPAHDVEMAGWLARMGRSALDRADFEMAVPCLRRALSEPPPAAERPGILLDLAAAEAALAYPSAVGRFRQAVMLGGSEPEPVARAAVRLLRALSGPVPFEGEIVDVLWNVLDRLDPSLDDLRFELELALRLATDDAGPTGLGRFERLLDELDVDGQDIAVLGRAFLVGQKLGDPRWADAGQVAAMIEPGLGARDLFRGDALARRIHFSSMVDLLRCGRYAAVDAMTQQCLAASTGEARPDAAPAVSILRGLSLLWQGDLAASEEACRQTLETSGEHQDEPVLLAQLCLLSVLLERGQVHAAAQFEGALSQAYTADPRLRLFVVETLARLRIAQGQVHRGLDELLAAGQEAERYGISNPAVTSWRQEAARVHFQLGQVEEAQRLAGEAVELARAFAEVRALGATLRAAAEIAGPDRKVQMLSEAVELLADSGVSLEAARAMVDLGEALSTIGRRDEARSALRRGAHLASLCGADHLVELASNQLRAAGARPRRVALTGLEALTPAELRVVALAAEGHTNARIAASLYVTDKTVEGHLARAYQKLGIHSRQELRPLLEGRETEGELGAAREDRPAAG